MQRQRLVAITRDELRQHEHERDRKRDEACEVQAEILRVADEHFEDRPADDEQIVLIDANLDQVRFDLVLRGLDSLLPREVLEQHERNDAENPAGENERGLR